MKLLKGAFRLLAALAFTPAAAFSSASSLGQSVVMNRFVTPNGDGRNDTFMFRCHNPRDAQVEGRIYTMSGQEVAKMRLKQRSNGIPPVTDNVSGEYYDLEWDPNYGSRYRGGMYLFQVLVEEKVYKGTIVVIR